MAEISDRLTANVAGKYYVDSSCIDCNLCRQIAPQIFVYDEESGKSCVARQPGTPEEIAQAEEAVADCPTCSIGNDG